MSLIISANKNTNDAQTTLILFITMASKFYNFEALPPPQRPNIDTYRMCLRKPYQINYTKTSRANHV